jgi:hypothetical protein
MGKISKGVKCNIVGCGRPAVRSIAPDRVAEAGLNIGKASRAYLCREHYKEMKKKLKKERMIEKWRLMR